MGADSFNNIDSDNLDEPVFIKDSTWQFEVEEDGTFAISGANSVHREIEVPDNDPRVIYMRGRLSNWTQADVEHIVQEEVAKSLANQKPTSCCCGNHNK